MKTMKRMTVWAAIMCCLLTVNAAWAEHAPLFVWETAQMLGKAVAVRRDGKYALVRFDGTECTEYAYTLVTALSGYVIVQDENGLQGLVCQDGTEIFPMEYAYIAQQDSEWIAAYKLFACERDAADIVYIRLHGRSAVQEWGKIKSASLYNMLTGEKMDELTREEFFALTKNRLPQETESGGNDAEKSKTGYFVAYEEDYCLKTSSGQTLFRSDYPIYLSDDGDYFMTTSEALDWDDALYRTADFLREQR